MAIETPILAKLKAGNYKTKKLDLSSQQLTDADIKILLSLLNENPNIVELNLGNNKLTKISVNALAKNTTLATLRLKPGNPSIKVTDLDIFLENTTLTALPFCGGGPKQQALRQHIASNKNRPVVKKVVAKEKKPEVIKPKKQTKIIKKNTNELDNVDHLDGEVCFLEHMHSFLFDLQDFNSEHEYVVWYMAIALNLFMHNASQRPMPGFGKAQKFEADKKLYYSRSQAHHPNTKLVDKLVKPVLKENLDTSKGEKLRSFGVGALNPYLIKVLEQSIIPDDVDEESFRGKQLRKKRQALITNLKKLNATHGFPQTGQNIPNYFSLFLAHGGLRTNNLTALEQALDFNSSEVSDDEAVKTIATNVKGLLSRKTSKAIKRLPPKEVADRIRAYQARFATLANVVNVSACQLWGQGVCI